MTDNDSTLSRAAFLILLALADQPRHGLGVIDEIDERTAGGVRMGPGTLYSTLHKLATTGLIQETATAPDAGDDDPRRRYYRLTPRGRRALRQEAGRLRALVQTALEKNVLEGA